MGHLVLGKQKDETTTSISCRKKGQGKTLINKIIYKHYNKTMSFSPSLW
jgi:hypothetical protein